MDVEQTGGNFWSIYKGAFASFEGFYKALKKRNFKVTKSKILKFLQNQETYTLHRRKINNFPRKRVRVNGLNDHGN
jgi:hypothetical protein